MGDTGTNYAEVHVTLFFDGAGNFISQSKKVVQEINNINNSSKRAGSQWEKVEQIIKKKTGTLQKDTAAMIKHRAELKKLMVAETQGIILDKAAIARKNELTRAMGANSLATVTLTKEVKGMSNKVNDSLKMFTRMRWMLVNVTMAYVLLSRVFKPLIENAIALETAMAGVMKTTGFNTAQVKEMRHEFVLLSRQIPVTAEDLANIGVVGGQLGLGSQGVDAMTSFVRASSLFATATGMSAEDAATNLAKISQAFNIPIDNAMRLGSVMNELENTTAATAAEIAEGMKRVGAAGSNLGVTVQFVAALEATLISAGMKASRAGTRIRSALGAISREAEKASKIAGVSYQEFVELLEDSPENALLAVLKGMEKNTDSAYEFGRVAGFAFETLVANLEDFETNLKTANDEWERAMSLTREAGIAAETTSGQWDLIKNSINSATIESGSFLNSMLQTQRVNAQIKDYTGKGILKQPSAALGPLRMLYVATQYKKMIPELYKEFKTLGEQAGLSAAVIDDELSKAMDTKSPVIMVDRLRAIIETQKALNVSTEVTASSLSDLDGIFAGLSSEEGFIKYANARMLSEAATSIDGITAATMKLNDVTEQGTKEYGSETVSAWSRFYKESTAGADSVSSSQNILATAFKIANKAIKEQIDIVKEQYKTLKSARFVGDAEAIASIHSVELAIKRETLAQLELQDAVDGTNRTLDSQKDSFSAWVETVQQFIRSSVIAGNELGNNVSSAIATYQTLLLSTSKFDGSDTGTTELERLQDERQKLQLEYDLGIGENKYQLGLYIDELERGSQIEFSSLTQAKNLLGDKWKELDKLNGIQKSITKSYDDAREAVDLYTSHLDDDTVLALTDTNLMSGAIDEIATSWRKAEIARLAYNPTTHTGTQQSFWNPESSPNFATDYVPQTPGQSINPELNFSDWSGGGQSILGGSVTPVSNNEDPETLVEKIFKPLQVLFNPLNAATSNLFNDFVMRPGSEPVSFSPDDTIVGVKDINGLGGGVTIGNITINGATGDAGDFAYKFAEELRRELKTR